MSLSGKHALITGSSRGIGRGIALKLADNGVNAAVHYYQNEAAALDTLAQVRERGADGFAVQADVLDPKQITQMFGKVKAEFGKLDIFVSNARPEAAAFFYPPMQITLEQWNAASDSQAKAFLVGVHEAVPLMIKGEESSPSLMPREAVMAGYNPGLAWVQPRPRWSPPCVTSRWLSPSAASQ
jgi:enoyl-[acyl-carrier protein] reductase III